MSIRYGVNIGLFMNPSLCLFTEYLTVDTMKIVLVDSSTMSNADLTRDVWEIAVDEFPSSGSIEEQARFLLRYAILAPSSHNSQPWEFVIDGERIEVHAAEDRWLDVADTDKRELYVSLGCAIENLCIAAEYFGLGYRTEYHDDATPVSVVTLTPTSEASSNRPTGLFHEITERYTNHRLFKDRPLPDGFDEQVQDCVLDNDVTLHLIDGPKRKGSIAELQARADRRQMENPAYRKELGYWIGIGALGASWLNARIAQAVVSHLNIGDREARKNSKLIQSAPVVGVLTADSDDPTARLKTGQAFERLALAATGEGIAVHPMSQILERSEMREELADHLPSDDALPQHLFRLGYPEESQEHTPRWPLETFLVDRA